MFLVISDNPTVAYAIQQAVAPVFLLAGIGAFLNVLTSRLARVVDRYRHLHEGGKAKEEHDVLEKRVLQGRASSIHWAITLCTLSALSVCLSIALLFIGVQLGSDHSQSVAFLFIAAMLALIFGLLFFLREIALATGVLATRHSRE